nr:C40 family peptidase [Frankia sp. CiP3]
MWGGNGDPGFDCSGLTHAAYAAVGISIPRTAQTQYDAGPRLAGRTPLAPGDLVFYGTSPTTISHVGVYTGGTRMIDAPHTGAVIRDEDYRWPTFIGATRPAATR